MDILSWYIVSCLRKQLNMCPSQRTQSQNALHWMSITHRILSVLTSMNKNGLFKSWLLFGDSDVCFMSLVLPHAGRHGSRCWPVVIVTVMLVLARCEHTFTLTFTHCVFDRKWIMVIPHFETLLPWQFETRKCCKSAENDVLYYEEKCICTEHVWVYVSWGVVQWTTSVFLTEV